MTNNASNIPLRGVFYGQLREQCAKNTHAFSYLRTGAKGVSNAPAPAVKARVMAKHPAAPTRGTFGTGTGVGAGALAGAGGAGLSLKPYAPTAATATVGAQASSTIGSGKAQSIINVSTINKATQEITDTIRIVVKDAKPPTVVRGARKVMRAICFVLLILVCALGAPRLFGVNEFNIITGSMNPTYPVGTLVFVQPKAADTIRPGEVVSYVANEDLDIITHRCVGNDYDNKTLTTRGDANNSEDAPVLYENVVGVVAYSLPYVGGVVDYLSNDQIGRVVLVGILVTILGLTIMIEQMSSYLTKKKAKVFSQGGEIETKGMKVRKVRRGRKKNTVTKLDFAQPAGSKVDTVKLKTGALSAKEAKAARQSKSPSVAGLKDKKRK